MNKDVIYIDVEDDITAIIGKVKASKEKIVALVPPKRIGILQSAVNLRLLARSAEQGGKHLVLITGNQALMALSASAKIPVAKNLQSKPEIAETSKPDGDNEEDVIDGSSMPVGQLAKGAGGTAADSVGQTIDNIETDGIMSSIKPTGPGKARVKNGAKVPSFNTFRKKVFLAVGAICLLVGFLVWAIVYAPQATVVIDARTTPTEVKTAVAIGPELATNAETGALKSVVQTEKKTTTIDFDATGTQDIGDKAKGTISFSTNSINKLGTTIPAGTQVTTTGGLVFTTDQSVTLTLGNYTDAPTGITALANGPKYNDASGDVTGAPSGVDAEITGATSGGTEKVIKIVLQEDVEKAKAQLVAIKDDAVKKSLQSKFGGNVVIIEDSFQASPAAPVSAPDVGKESKDGKAKLTSEVTYTMSAIAKVDLSAYLKSALEKQLDKEEQRVYKDGLSTAKLTGFTQNNGNTSITLAAMGQIGPKINDDQIKNTVKSKKAAEIREELKQIEGINDAETKFSPFWVNVVPNDSKKIKIEFKLQDESKS